MKRLLRFLVLILLIVLSPNISQASHLGEFDEPYLGEIDIIFVDDCGKYYGYTDQNKEDVERYFNITKLNPEYRLKLFSMSKENALKEKKSFYDRHSTDKMAPVDSLMSSIVVVSNAGLHGATGSLHCEELFTGKEKTFNDVSRYDFNSVVEMISSSFADQYAFHDPDTPRTIGVIWMKDINASPTKTLENMQLLEEAGRQYLKPEWKLDVIHAEQLYEQEDGYTVGPGDDWFDHDKQFREFCKRHDYDRLYVLSCEANVEHIDFRSNHKQYDHADVGQVHLIVQMKAFTPIRTILCGGAGGNSSLTVKSLDYKMKEAWKDSIRSIFVKGFPEEMWNDSEKTGHAPNWTEALK